MKKSEKNWIESQKLVIEHTNLIIYNAVNSIKIHKKALKNAKESLMIETKILNEALKKYTK